MRVAAGPRQSPDISRPRLEEETEKGFHRGLGQSWTGAAPRNVHTNEGRCSGWAGSVDVAVELAAGALIVR